MTTVLLQGRKLPAQDFEGDDATPGANGKWVSCTDTALGRGIAYATNGRIDRDGKVYRAAVPGHDPDGITLHQAAVAARAVADVKLVIPDDWRWAQVLTHLKARRGLIVQGWYAQIPRAFRFQASAEFGHAMWISHLSPTSGMRVWDPLDANTTRHGQWVPASAIRVFMEELSRRNGTSSLYCAYVPLQMP
jgi:hypothetical protein